MRWPGRDWLFGVVLATMMLPDAVTMMPRFLIFQRLVFDATEGFVASIDPATFEDIVVPYPYGPGIDQTFSARVGGEAGISRSDALECWIYQHGLRHMGEIEHARALVGLGGMTS